MVPEQRHVASMRDLVVDDGGFTQSNPPFIAVGTLAERMLPQPSSTCLLPGAGIEALIGRATMLIVFPHSRAFVLGAAPRFGEHATTRPRARS